MQGMSGETKWDSIRLSLSLSPEDDSEKEIWDRLIKVFVRQLNVRPEEVTMGASITRDLGVC